MSWKVSTIVEQRREFMEAVASEDSPGVAALCREFGISRKTAYKWIGRYRKSGDAGLVDLPRVAKVRPHALSAEIERLIIQAREAFPHWGAKKLLVYLVKKHPGCECWPCIATISTVLDRNQLVRRRKKPRPVPAFDGVLSRGEEPNDVWCMDHKGWWSVGNGDKCEPFTVSDDVTRFLIRCMPSVGKGIAYVRPVLQAAFCEYGLPRVIRSDNGPPFASRAPLGLSELAVWLIRLGIRHERIEPGKPQQNARHERIHLTMITELAGPVGATLHQEQKRLKTWSEQYNYERPHEALGMKTPGSLYTRSPRPMPRRLPEPEYGPALRKRKVDSAGSFHWNGKELFLTEALRGQCLGFEASEKDGVWLVWLDQMLLGSFDERHFKMTWGKRMTHRCDFEQ